MLAEPPIDFGRFDVIRDTFTKGLDNQRHSAFENYLLSNHLKLDPFVFHVRGHPPQPPAVCNSRRRSSVFLPEE
jgi:hypothetical protein